MAISEKEFRTIIAAIIAIILIAVLYAATGSLELALLVALFIGAFDLWYLLIWMDGPRTKR